VQPVRLSLVDGSPYLWAWDTEDAIIKRYDLGRFADVALAPSVTGAPANVASTVKGRLIGAFAGVSRERGMRVVLRAAPTLTPLLRNRTLGRAQRMTELSDGGLRNTFNTSGAEGVLRWVLSFGKKMTVEGPKELRGEVERELRGASLRYRKQ
jgi:predicted DNA-binding transcriptional regulator YafY